MQDIILKPFLYKERLKFSEIEKATKLRSNHLSYHLQNLVDTGILKKEEGYYMLSHTTEKKIPEITTHESPLTVILILLESEEGEVFLVKRDKRPFQGKLGLPGGRLMKGESIQDATERIGKKWGISCNYEGICAVNLEHVIKEDEIMHSFLLILVSATTSKAIQYQDLKEVRDLVITSDYELILSKSREKIGVPELFTAY